MTAQQNHHFKTILMLLGLMGFTTLVTAGDGTCESVQNGLWNDPTIWTGCANGSGIPEINNFVIIKGGHEVTLNVDVTIINSLDMEFSSVLRVASNHSITTDEGGFALSPGSVILEGGLTLNDNNSDGINMGTVDGGHNLTLNTDADINFDQPVGNTTPLNTIFVNSLGTAYVSGNINLTGSLVFGNDVSLNNSITLSASTVTFSNDLKSNLMAGDGYDLTIEGNAVFNASIGALSPVDQVNVYALTINGNTLINGASSLEIFTDWAQSYNGVTTIEDDTTFISVDGGNLSIRDDIMAVGQNIAFNTAGITTLSANSFNGGYEVQAASITTDAPGRTDLLYNGTYNINSDSVPTTFNDAVQMGPSTRITINQAGAADVIFNDEVALFSGGPKQLTVNDVSGRTVFNGPVSLGKLTTNDGAGEDVTIINTSSVTTNQGGANDGILNFNDPVLVLQSTVFSETGSGQINFNNTLDAGDGLNDVDININSDADVTMGATGTTTPFRLITTDVGGSMQLNGDVISINNTSFNDDVTLFTAVQLSSNNVNLLANVELQTNDLTLSGVDGAVSGAISGSGSLISNLDDDLNLNGENTYSGSTLINDGDLNLSAAPSNNNISGSTNIYLALNSNLIPRTGNGFDLANGQTLSGDGFVGGSLYALDGSVISPGASPGVLGIDLLYLHTGSTYEVEIGGPTAGTDFDQISTFIVDLDFDSLGGAALAVSVTGAIDIDDQFLILEKDDGGPIDGTFLGLPEGSTVTANDGYQFSITYAGGINSNDVVLTSVCSPNITVTDPGDSGAGTLRQAVDDLCQGGTIDFASTLSISLMSEILLDADLTIDGSGQVVTLSGSSISRIFNVSENVAVNLIGLDVISGASNGQGGAIYNNGSLTISDSWFDNNVSNDGAVGGGAIVNRSTGTLTINDSTFTNNSANRGGALFNDGGTLNIVNSTFTQNGTTTFEGGAIHNRGIFNATNITVAGNGTTNTIGGGLFTWNGSQFLNNTLIADNLGITDCDISLNNSSQSNNNSLIESGNCEAALTDDPQLQALANNGGNTLTMALALTSPAVDAGSDALCTAVDQRGVARPQLAGCDIGAFETEYLGIIHVSQNSPTHSGACYPGACWSNAYDNMTDALAVAGPTSQLWVAEGVYRPDVGTGVVDDDPTASFNIGSGVMVYGGFAGTETALEQRDVNAHLTVLSGDIDANDTDVNGDGVIESIADIMGTNAYNIMQTTGAGITLDGFTITAGHASGNSASRRTGAGILCETSDGNVHVFANNQWIANYAEDNGGAMFECGGNITASTYQANQADENGGAIAIFTDLALDFSDVAFLGNQSGFSGGAVLSADSTFDRITVVGNSTGVIGGGVFAFGFLDLSNSLIAGNYAGEDGAGLTVYQDSDLRNVTITGNVAAQDGGGLYVFDGGQPFIEIGITNSILWHNQDQSGAGTLTASLNVIDPASISYTILQGSGGSSNWDPAAGIDSGNNLDLNPDFVQDIDLLAVPTTNGNARLLPVSAAIGTGWNTAVIGNQDLDGNARINGGTVDMGAYEYGDLIFANDFE